MKRGTRRRSVVPMAEFMVEYFVARGDGAAVGRDAERTRRAAMELTREGTPVSYLRSIFVPEDETCFLLYEAASADAVREVARRTGIPFDRVADVIGERKGER